MIASTSPARRCVERELDEMMHLVALGLLWAWLAYSVTGHMVCDAGCGTTDCLFGVAEHQRMKNGSGDARATLDTFGWPSFD